MTASDTSGRSRKIAQPVLNHGVVQRIRQAARRRSILFTHCQADQRLRAHCKIGVGKQRLNQSPDPRACFRVELWQGFQRGLANCR